VFVRTGTPVKRPMLSPPTGLGDQMGHAVSISAPRWWPAPWDDASAVAYVFVNSGDLTQQGSSPPRTRS